MLQEAVFQHFFEQAEIANFSAEERKTYHESLKDYWDMCSVIETADKKGYVRGHEEGANHKAVSIARNLLSMGMSKDQVALATGLSVGELCDI